MTALNSCCHLEKTVDRHWQLDRTIDKLKQLVNSSKQLLTAWTSCRQIDTAVEKAIDSLKKLLTAWKNYWQLEKSYWQLEKAIDSLKQLLTAWKSCWQCGQLETAGNSFKQLLTVWNLCPNFVTAWISSCCQMDSQKPIIHPANTKVLWTICATNKNNPSEIRFKKHSNQLINIVALISQWQ